MTSLKPLVLCVIAFSLHAQESPSAVPDSILHVNKVEQGQIEFRVGGSAILALGLAISDNHIGWDDYCQRPFQPGQISTVPAAGRIVTVVSTSGVYGNKAAVATLYRRYTAADAIWRKRLDLAKTYSTDSKTFVRQITSALAEVPLPDRTKSEEDSAVYVALTLLKSNLRILSEQTAADPRRVILLFLSHNADTYDVCVKAAGAAVS